MYGLLSADIVSAIMDDHVHSCGCEAYRYRLTDPAGTTRHNRYTARALLHHLCPLVTLRLDRSDATTAVRSPTTTNSRVRTSRLDMVELREQMLETTEQLLNAFRARR